MTNLVGTIVGPVTRTGNGNAAPVTNGLAQATNALTETLTPVTRAINRIATPPINAVTQTLGTVGQIASEPLADLVGGIVGGGGSPPTAGLLPTLPPIIGAVSGVVESVGAVPVSPGVPPLTPPNALALLLPGGSSGTTGSPAAPARAAGPGGAAGGPLGPSSVLGTTPALALQPAITTALARLAAPPHTSTPLVPTGLLSALLASAGGSWAALAYAARNGNPPARGASAPLQAPAPGTAVPSSAGGASGFGFSIFITLAALLVLGAPWTRRRLRLAGRPRWPAPFVLIPDRPG